MKHLGKCLILAFVLFFGFVIYDRFNMYNPDSILCHYKIYKQTNGTFEVWNKGMWDTMEMSFKTYEEAKVYQLNQCRTLNNFGKESPKGERIK